MRVAVHRVPLYMRLEIASCAKGCIGADGMSGDGGSASDRFRPAKREMENVKK